MKKSLVLIIRFIHLFSLLFVIFAWLLPYRLATIIHLFFVPLMIVQWKLNQNRCLLTDLENYLDNTSVQQEPGGFIKSILKKFYDPLPSEQKIKITIYTALLISYLISLLRVLL